MESFKYDDLSPDFKLIYQSDRSLIYRTQQLSTDKKVVVKFLNQEFPSLKQISRFKQEYEIIKNQDSDKVIKAYGFNQYKPKLSIVFEDFGGKSLDILFRDKKIGMDLFFDLAIKIVAALNEIHSQEIIHKDINPSNIIYNPATGELKIIDFGLAIKMPKEENTAIKNLNLLEGTLAYIAPEQTGRMNRYIDYRSDFYALGVTFYELLTGKQPFITNNPLKLIHCHISKLPIPPHELSPEIPEVISNIVSKLMAKEPEDRYQSGFGLKADLEECQRQWFAKGEIALFRVGQQDIRDRLQISQKLYGREQQVGQLLDSFDRVKQGATEMMLVSGYSGIGKSVLVREIYKPITLSKGYFIGGKFEQYQRERPYSAIIQALKELIRLLLTEPETQLKQWCEQLLKALGRNAGVIIEEIPELEQIIGQQSAVRNLPPTESQNRFNITFQKFIEVFAGPKHPLVIFLDDLQWSDSASLQLIESLIVGLNIKHLLLIGAYRDNEVNPGHRFLTTLKEIEKAGAKIDRISLIPLKLSEIASLIADSLNCTQEVANPLAELILAKTDGNPFFINQFLTSLYREKLLFFERKTRNWQWNLAKIKTKEATDNVVQLLTQNIQELSPQIQKILQIAACIGNHFEIRILAAVARISLEDTVLLLNKVIAEGLIVTLRDDVLDNNNEITIEYKFIHDSIQQAAYSLIPREQKTSLHWQIGQILLSLRNAEQEDEKIFNIVNQLNLSEELLKDRKQKEKLTRLNLQAGKKAKSSGAFESTYKYLNSARELLDRNSWNSQYDLTLCVYTEAVEAAYLIGNLEQLEQLTKEVLEKTKSLLDKIKVYEIQISVLL